MNAQIKADEFVAWFDQYPKQYKPPTCGLSYSAIKDCIHTKGFDPKYGGKEMEQFGQPGAHGWFGLTKSSTTALAVQPSPVVAGAVLLATLALGFVGGRLSRARAAPQEAQGPSPPVTLV